MQMAEMAKDNDLEAMVKLYHDKAVPQSVAFQKGLQDISRQLRMKAGGSAEAEQP
jgi:hypothetical protein